MSPAEQRFPVIDADAHVLETQHTWDYLEPGQEGYRPDLYSSETTSGREFWVIDGKIAGLRMPTLSEQQLRQMSEETHRNVMTDSSAREMEDVKLRINHLDQLGIDYQVLYNTMWITPLTDRPDADIALCASWNRWMADIWREGEGRLRWTTVVPTTDREAAREQMRFAKENGAVAVCLRPFDESLYLTNPYFYPIYEEAVALQMAVVIHVANGNHLLNDALNTGRGDSGWAKFRIPVVATAFDIIMSGIHKDFPTLNWGLIEASAQWMSWVACEVSRRTGKTFGPDSNPFIDNNMFVTCQASDDLSYLIQTLGDGALVIGTDYGHTDVSSDIDAIMGLKENKDIPKNAVQNILSVNPAKLYGLSDLEMPAGAAK